VVSRKPTNIVNPRKEPKRDILILRSFDFINNINSKTTVVFKPAIFAALMGQKGLINTIGWSWSVLSVVEVWRKDRGTVASVPDDC